MALWFSILRLWLNKQMRKPTAKENAHLHTAPPPPIQGMQKSISLPSFCPRQKKNKFPNASPAYLQTNRTESTAYNSVLAKDGVNIVFENSVNNIRKNAFHISYFRNLEI